jgi:hypothetical protein
MKSGKFLLLLLVIIGVTSSPSARAEDETEIGFDVFLRDSCVTVWLDLTSPLTSRAMDRLEEGIDLALECRVSLLVPRRLWGDRQVAAQDRTLRLSYLEITGEYLVAIGGRDPDAPYRAESMPELFKLLGDSVDFCLSPLSALDADQRYVLQLDVTAISLTDFNLAEEIGSGDRADSPLRYLFHQFLRLTDYGRREYAARSRSFALSELESVDQ